MRNGGFGTGEAVITCESSICAVTQRRAVDRHQIRGGNFLAVERAGRVDAERFGPAQTGDPTERNARGSTAVVHLVGCRSGGRECLRGDMRKGGLATGKAVIACESSIRA